MNIAVIFAGGVGSRMHSKSLPKQFLKVHGRPILVHTISVFQRHPMIDAVVVASHPEWIDHCWSLCRDYGLTKVREIVPGGETGQVSIFNGLEAAERVADGSSAVVLIHDGVRPLITADTVTANIESVQKWGSAITAVRVKETVLEVDDDDMVRDIPLRENSRLARAPQSFWLEEVLTEERWAVGSGRVNYIDTASLMYERGHQLHLVYGPDENIKVTTPDDFFSMRAVLDARENEQIYIP